MKLDPESSLKYKYVKKLKLVKGKMEEIELSNGKLKKTITISSICMVSTILNVILNTKDLNLTLGMLNVIITMISGVVLDRSIMKKNKNKELIKELEEKKKRIIKIIKNKDYLDDQFQELNKMLTKKR